MLLIAILDAIAGCVLYGVHRLAGRFGLAPLFALVAAGFIFQALLTPSVVSPVLGDLSVFTASGILVGAALFAVLLVFLEDGVGSVRRLISSVVLTTAILGLLIVAVRWGLSSGTLVSLSPGTELFQVVNVPVLALAICLFILDAILVLGIHEALAARVRWLPSAVRIVVALVPVVVLDGILLFAIRLEPILDSSLLPKDELLAGNILGRLVSGLVYGVLLAGLLRLPGSVETRGTAEIRDPLAMFTYRDRMKLLERQKERTELSLRNLFESNIVGMSIVTLEGTILSANESFLEIIRRDQSELPLDWLELTPREWRALEEAKAHEIRATGSAQLWEKEFERKDGARVPALVAMTLTSDREGECLAVVLDLSQRREAEAALERSESLYRSLFDGIPLMYFSLDCAGTVLLVNRHGAEELGYEPSELVGRSVLGVFHPEDRPRVEEGLREVASGGAGVARWEFRKVRKDGSVLWVRESVRAVDKTGSRREIFVVCENITAEKEVERQIREHERQLQILSAALPAAEERERRQIATGLHDEVGQLLAVAKARLDELRGTDAATAGSRLNREMAEVGKLVDQSIEAVRGLTFDLGSPVLYELGLEAGLEHLIEQTESRHGVRFVFDSDGSLRDLRGELGNILFRIARELVRNVVKHAGASTARLRLATESDEIHMSIEDQGAGFDASDAGRALTPEGGFGLFSVREQLVQIGGRFEIDSAPDRGTRVRVVVPRGQAST